MRFTLFEPGLICTDRMRSGPALWGERLERGKSAVARKRREAAGKRGRKWDQK